MQKEEIRAGQWLGLLPDKSAWLTYFNDLINDDDGEKNNNGVSFASGVGKPRLLKIMGQHLRPLEVLDVNDANESTVGVDECIQREAEEVLARQ